ncbi:MAG: hypothetical protein QM346_12595 [Chloroflexota bacterium]|nr:hypothetical protein [Chloroflexota bacterium]
MQEPREQNGRWWSRRWRQMLAERGVQAENYTTGNGARVKRLEVLPGRAVAMVQPRTGDACMVEVRIPTWSEADWERALETLGHQALYGAHLMAGELPPDLESALGQAGVSLLPAPQEAIVQICSCCGEIDAPCEHVLAVYRALGELLADNPWLLLRLRGKDQQQALHALRLHRERKGNQQDDASPADDQPAPGTKQVNGRDAPGGAETPEPLDTDPAAFWGSARAQEEYRPFIVPPAVELALLRRLGPPAFTHASIDAYETLAEIYRQVSREALALAYAADPVSETTDQEEPPS